MSIIKAEYDIYACAGAVLASNGYSVDESPEYAQEIEAYSHINFLSPTVWEFEAEPSSVADTPTWCAGCQSHHNDYRDMFKGVETEFVS